MGSQRGWASMTAASPIFEIQAGEHSSTVAPYKNFTFALRDFYTCSFLMACV